MSVSQSSFTEYGTLDGSRLGKPPGGRQSNISAGVQNRVAVFEPPRVGIKIGGVSA